MPAVIAWLVGALGQAVVGYVFRALLALGIGYVTYQGVDLLMSGAEDKVFASLGSLGPTTMALVGVLKVGQCIKVAFVALAIKVSIMGASGGKLTKMVTKSTS